jgi:cytoskeletal protein RodZ
MSKSLIGLFSLFFLAFALFATMVLFRTQIASITRAKEDSVPSEKNTLVFAWPLRLPADGKSESTITVFVRSSNGRPLSSKVVTATSSLGQIQNSPATSDKEGKVTFQLSSDTPGVANIQTTAEDVKILQSVSIKFE